MFLNNNFRSRNGSIYNTDFQSFPGLRTTNGYSSIGGFSSTNRYKSSYGRSSSRISAFKGVDLHCETNNTDHHTNSLSVRKLIVRRGQPFNMTLRMEKPFNPDSDQLTMKVETGRYPSEEKGTMSSFGIPEGKHSASAKAVWKAELEKNCQETGDLDLKITLPADAPVGKYKLSATLKAEEKELAELCVLFNPWCPEDLVFLPNEAERQEYVMNQYGIIYVGSDTYISEVKWDFGQFEENMVEICMTLLDRNMKYKRDPADDVCARCNPIYVSRVITNMVNNDTTNNGVLTGNWTGDYICGYSPTHWSGSYAILKNWYGNFCNPVKFGQCWVFAGVMCSVMRLLGIPCRVVTNFQSAHDSDCNLTIDTFLDELGRISKLNGDSIWNFHVWVEGWMRRPDLADDNKYDGWQALDGTPQEKSEGVFCCGPAPVAAILNGDTNLKYDIPFVFAEVNADEVQWQIKRDGSRKKTKTSTSKVGQKISTKSVGSNHRMDITNNYKYEEGTYMERAVFKKAMARLKNEPEDDISSGMIACPESLHLNITEQKNEAPNMTITFEEESKPVNGQDVNLKLVLRGTGDTGRMLTVRVSVQAMTYTGAIVGDIQSESVEKELLPAKDVIVPIHVPYSNYKKEMLKSQTMNISALINDPEADQIYLETTRVVLGDPSLSITVSEDAQVNKKMTAEVSFKNPIEEELKNCTLTLCGSGLVDGEHISQIPNLGPGEKFYTQCELIPKASGERTLLADFDCDAFRDIKSSIIFHVKD